MTELAGPHRLLRRCRSLADLGPAKGTDRARAVLSADSEHTHHESKDR